MNIAAVFQIKGYETLKIEDEKNRAPDSNEIPITIELLDHSQFVMSIGDREIAIGLREMKAIMDSLLSLSH